MGSQYAAEADPFDWLAGPSTASRLYGSFAKAYRLLVSQAWAPERHAFSYATTWSICTAELVFTPRVNVMVLPV